MLDLAAQLHHLIGRERRDVGGLDHHRHLRGRRYVSDTVADLLTQRLSGDADAPAHQQLSEREFQVLHKLATGKSVTEIADELFISVKSVSTYRSRLLTKLNLKSNAELTYYALKNGLIE